MHETLSEIIELCREGDEDALSELVRRFHRWAHDLAAVQVDCPHRVDDVVQEAFCAAIRGLPRLRSSAAFPSWLRQIVRRTAARANRADREVSLEQLPDAPDPTAGADDVLSSEELRARVRRAVASLPVHVRSAVELFYFEERSCREVSDLLHIPGGTVRRRLHDGRQRLREMLLGIDEGLDEQDRISKPPL